MADTANTQNTTAAQAGRRSDAGLDLSAATYLVTGATGHLGSTILRHLARLVPADRLVAGAHTPAKARKFADQGMQVARIDFFDEKTLVDSFSKADVLVYVPSKSTTSFPRVQELENVIAAARKAGIRHILAMGFIADQPTNPFTLSAFYGYLPRRLSSSGIGWTIIRDALYADPLVPYLPELQERHAIIYPVGDQKLSFIPLDDCAAAFAKVATTPSLLRDEKIWTLTAERAWTMPELADLLTRVGGTKIGYAPVSVEEFGRIYSDPGDDELSSMYAGGAKGQLSEVSDDYRTIMGHPATDLETFLRRALTSPLSAPARD